MRSHEVNVGLNQ